MSALTPKADIKRAGREVRFVPKADVSDLFDHLPGASGANYVYTRELAESCDCRGVRIDFTNRQRVWAPAKSAQCQPAAPGKVDRTDEAVPHCRK
jgi:hypothetical protein